MEPAGVGFDARLFLIVTPLLDSVVVAVVVLVLVHVD